MVLFPSPLQLSEVVGIAQGMGAFILVVLLLVIMTQHTLEKGAYSTESYHPFHVKVATQTTAKLPPIGA